MRLKQNKTKKPQESLVFCMFSSCLIWRREVTRETQRRGKVTAPFIRDTVSYYIIYESLPSSTCLGRHMLSDLWTRFHLLFRVKCVLFLSYSSSQLTPKPRNLRKILWVIHQKIIGDIQNFSLHNRSLRIHWLHITGKPPCCANYIISSFRLSQPLERILSGRVCESFFVPAWWFETACTLSWEYHL